MAKDNSTPAELDEARRLGLKLYRTGKPCRRGHIADRYTCDQSCAQCKAEDSEARRVRALSDPKLAETMRAWHRESKARARQTPEGRNAHYEGNKRYVNKHREKVLTYYRGRRAHDADYRMACWCRSVLHKLLTRSNQRKDARCVVLLGYTAAELRAHIERQFTRGMEWGKVGAEIHIDHIIPVAEMLRRGESQPSVVHALSNLRPMWAKENMRKSDKVVTLL